MNDAADDGRRRRVLVAVLVTAGAVLLACAAFLVGRSAENGVAPPVAESSVDAGFARDMAVHHEQAVLMASYTRIHAPSSQIRSLATSIDTQQQLEVGRMQGWLDAWGLGRTSDVPAMAWVPGHSEHGAHGTMPGMATPAELDRLVNLSGKRLEVRFLQLMIRHHQGGLPMAQHATEHARTSYVRRLAASMVLEQQRETDLMLHLLEERGGSPLPN
jgi:uncharacterized protein (DUF305 family)